MPTAPIELKAPQLAGGISRQPAHERFPGQVSDANNAIFSLADGACKRPGSLLAKKIALTSPYNSLYPAATLVSGSVYLIHPINRDATEKYLVIYAINCLRVVTTAGEECTVQGLNVFGLTPNPADYFVSNSATAQQLRLLSVADYTIIANTTVPLQTSTTPNYTITAEWPDYDHMVAHTPTSLPGSTSVNTAGDNSYHKTNKSVNGELAGYYKYDVSGNTFPTIQFATVTQSPADFDAAFGFKIRFEKRQDSFTNGTWTAATKRLVKTNNWTTYNHQSGDQVYISSGTGWSANWYTVVRKVSASELELASGSASDGVNVAGAGIGQAYNVEWSSTDGTLPSMGDVAQFIQNRLQSAGAEDALVEWVSRSTTTGYFVITAPWRGSGAKVTSVTTNPSAPDDVAFTDLSTASRCFDPTGAVRVDGSGSGPRTLAPDDRWTRVAAPGDVDGSLLASSAPIKLVRASPATSGTITGINVSTPNNCTVTTAAAHGLVAGQVVTIAGTSTTPTTVGSFIVQTVPTTTTFTIGVITTAVAVGTGTFTAPAHFTYDFIDWKNRLSGTDVSNPAPKAFRDGLKITDLAFHRHRFCMSAGERVMMSATDDLFRFYLDDAENVVDSDPIDVSLSSDRVTIIDFMVPIRNTLMVTTLAGQHYALSAPDILSPSTAAFTRSMVLTTHRVRPVPIDPTMYLLATANGKSQLREAYFVDEAVPNDAADVSAHVAGTGGDAGLLPSNPQTMVGHANSRRLFILKPSTNKLQVYQCFWVGPKKEQSAWSQWTWDAGHRISDIAVIDDDLYCLMDSSSQFVLEKVPMFESAAGNYNYSPHIDRAYTFAAGTGVFGVGVTTWTLPGSLSDTTLNCIVRENGAQITVLAAAGTTITATGDFSAVAVTIGRTYAFSITLSEPFLRDRLGQPNLDVHMLQRQIICRHTNTGAYTITTDFPVGSDATFTFTPPSGYFQAAGQFSAWANGILSQDVVTISSTSPHPVNIAGLTQLGEWGVRFHTGG